MDDPERGYLLQRIEALEQARRRWMVAAVGAIGAVALLFFLGLGALLTLGLFMTTRVQVERARAMEEAERARQAEVEARAEAERARMQAEDPAHRADKPKENEGKAKKAP